MSFIVVDIVANEDAKVRFADQTDRIISVESPGKQRSAIRRRPFGRPETWPSLAEV
jgi:hypothetical protein